MIYPARREGVKARHPYSRLRVLQETIVPQRRAPAAKCLDLPGTPPAPLARAARGYVMRAPRHTAAVRRRAYGDVLAEAATHRTRPRRLPATKG